MAAIERSLLTKCDDFITSTTAYTSSAIAKKQTQHFSRQAKWECRLLCSRFYRCFVSYINNNTLKVHCISTAILLCTQVAWNWTKSTCKTDSMRILRQEYTHTIGSYRGLTHTYVTLHLTPMLRSIEKTVTSLHNHSSQFSKYMPYWWCSLE